MSELENCRVCQGKGVFTMDIKNEKGEVVHFVHPCVACKGTGKVPIGSQDNPFQSRVGKLTLD